MYLGVRIVLAKSIERIHKANLINFCIVPVEFDNPSDYDKINSGDNIEIEGLLDAIKLKDKLTIKNKTGKFDFTGILSLTERERNILLSAGLLNYTKEKAALGKVRD